MNWADIGAKIANYAPTLGTLLGGPTGAAVGALIAAKLGTEATPDAISAFVSVSSGDELTLKLQTLEAESKAVAEVNATMRIEAASEHWLTYSWRPLIGLAVAFDIVVSAILAAGVFLAQVFGAPGAAVAVAALPGTLGSLAAIMGLALPVLGIASYFRGKMQADPAIPTTNRG